MAVLAIAPAARASPTCQDAHGDSIRCGISGAMPVGWVLPAEMRLKLPAPSQIPPQVLFGLICAIGGFFALIALMPDFDGWRSGDWDRQQDDEEEAG